MSVVTLPDSRSSRCFCDYNWIIKSKRICKDQWMCEEPNIHILSCGHGLHENCYHTVLRICRDLQKPFHCPECEPHWTRPRDMQRRMTGEINKPFIKYCKCLCSEDQENVDLRLEKNADGQWAHGVYSTKDPSVEFLPCGHAFHKNCWRTFQRILNEIKIEAACPFCKPPEQDKAEIEQQLVEIKHDRDEIRTQFDRYKQDIAVNILAKEKHERILQLSKGKQHWMIVAKTFMIAFVIFNLFKCAADINVSFPLIDKNVDLQRFHLFFISLLIAGIQYRLLQKGR